MDLLHHCIVVVAIMSEVSLSTLGRKVTLNSGKSITLGFTGAIPFANHLTNCTPHPINIEITNSSGKTQLVPIGDTISQPLLLDTEPQGRIRTLSLMYYSDGDDDDTDENEIEINKDGDENENEIEINKDDDDEMEGPSNKRQKKESLTSVNIFDPQRFCGFKKSLPKISRSLCAGILVNMPVGEYLETLNEEQLDKLIPAEETDIDEYAIEDELDQAPMKRRRVPVFGPDTAPDSVVRNERGIIIGCKRLVGYNAVY